MQLKARILRAQGAQKIFVPLDTKVRMKATLHQNAGATERDRLIDLFTDFIYRAHVSIGCAGPAIERAEGADHVADVCIIDIPVDDVGDNVVGMATLAKLVGRCANAGDVKGFEQRGAILCAESAAIEPFFQDSLNLRVWHRQ